MRLALVLALVAAPSPSGWAAPVGGAPVRLFDLGADPFEAGRHRGVDLAAQPGEVVRSACAGWVVFAGKVAGVGTVSVRCGRWRVSYAPLRPAVRPGRRALEGDELGHVGAAHRGSLHFGVRREGRRFGYVDPLGFLARSAPAPPPVPPRPPPPPRRDAARPPPPAQPAIAPWPVWLGLGLLLTGLVGAGTVRATSAERRPRCRASSISSSSPTIPSGR